MERCKARQQGVFRYTVANYFAGSGLMTRNLKKNNGSCISDTGKYDSMGESTAMDIKEVLPQTAIHFIDHAGHFARVENEKQVNEFFEQVGKDLR